jgi:hypothetical protein
MMGDVASRLMVLYSKTFPGSDGAIVNQGATRGGDLAVATLDAPLGATLPAVISKPPEGNAARDWR